MKGQIMKKTHKDSYMERFHLRSQLAREIFGSGSRFVVLQIMTLPESECIAEVVNREDYEKREQYLTDGEKNHHQSQLHHL